MKKAFRFGAVLSALVMMVSALTPASLAAGDKPETAAPVVDFSYLPEGQELTLANDLGGVLGTQMVTSKDLVVSKVKEGGEEWLLYHRKTTNWNGGIYLDLIRAKAKKKAVTNWTGATTIWFYAKATGDVYLNVALATDNEDSGQVQGYFDSEIVGAKYLLQENGAFVEKTTTEDTWKHMLIPSGYEGWVGFDLSQMNCRSNHLKDKTIAGHYKDIFGVGFYMEGADIYIRDIRVSGVTAKIGETDPTTTAQTPDPTTTAPPAVTTTAGNSSGSSDGSSDASTSGNPSGTTDGTADVDGTTVPPSSPDVSNGQGGEEEQGGLPLALIVLLCVLGAGAVAVGVVFLVKWLKGRAPQDGGPDDGADQ